LSEKSSLSKRILTFATHLRSEYPKPSYNSDMTEIIKLVPASETAPKSRRAPFTPIPETASEPQKTPLASAPETAPESPGESLTPATALSKKLRDAFLGNRDWPASEVIIRPDPHSHHERYKHWDTRLLGGYIENFLTQSELPNSSATARREFFADLSAADFIDLTKIIGGLLRGQKIGTLAEFDGTYEQALGGIEVPYAQDKAAVLKEFWQLARQFLNDQGIENPHEALAYASIMAANAIILVHPFVDMNGRTSRLLSYIIFNGAPSKQIWEEILSQHDGRTDSGSWALNNIATQRGMFLKFDKNSFQNPQQPDKIIFDLHQSPSHVFKLREWSIRAIIDAFDHGHVQECLVNNLTRDESGATILDGEQFLSQIVAGERAVPIQEIKRLVGREILAGNFLRAMKTESPYAYGSENSLEDTVITPQDFTINQPDEISRVKHERARAMLKYFVPSVDFTDESSIQAAILQLPLRKQVLVERVQMVSDFAKIYAL
jgi:hypothetical protein